MRTKASLMAAAAFSLLWAMSAEARPKPAPKPDPRDAEIQALKDEVRALEAKVDALSARAERPPPAPATAPLQPPTALALPVIQTSTPAPVPTAASFPTAGGATIVAGRPSIASADGRFSANLHAVMQFDAADYQQKTAGPLTIDFRRGAAATDTARARDLSSGTNFRRARFGVDGRAFGDWDYNLLLEFGGAGEEDAGHIQELWVQYSGLKPFHARIGAFAPSVGLQDQGSSNSSLFPERAASADIARNLAGGDFREAAEVWGATDRWYVNAAVTGRVVGVVNSQATGVAQPFDNQLSFIGRLAFLPIRRDGLLVEVGLHGSYVDRPADVLGPDAPAGAARYAVTLQERPELRVDGTRLISTGGINARHAAHWGVEVSGEAGPLFLQSEYDHFEIERAGVAAGVSDPSFRGFYVEGAYTLTGERRRFNAAGWAWDGPSVSRPFSPKDGTWGAFELAARYSDIDLNYHAGALGTAPSAEAVRGGEQRIWTGGLNWYPNTFVRFMLDYQDVRIERLSPSASSFQTPVGVQVGQHYHVIVLRSQFAF